MVEIAPCPRCGLTVTSARRHEEEADGSIRVWHLGCWFSHQWEGGHFDRRQQDRRQPDGDRRTGHDRRQNDPPPG